MKMNRLFLNSTIKTSAHSDVIKGNILHPYILLVYSVTKQFTDKTNAWSKQTVLNEIKFFLLSGIH